MVSKSCFKTHEILENTEGSNPVILKLTWWVSFFKIKLSSFGSEFYISDVAGRLGQHDGYGIVFTIKFCSLHIHFSDKIGGVELSVMA